MLIPQNRSDLGSIRNTLLVQKVLEEQVWLEKMQPEDFRGLTPLFYSHITPYGEFALDMNKRIDIEGAL